jgi:mannose-6-phosphate isomerase
VTLHRLINPVMPYAWGSHEAIAALQRRPAGDGPEAELWIGAHPHAPSRLERDLRTLPELIAAAPLDNLGERVIKRFGERLPFMVKVIAAEEALSLQVHPDDEQARAGFARESAAGLDLADPRRCYRDPNAKPEMILPLSDFDALLDFRPPDDALRVLSSLAVPTLEPVLARLRDGAPTGEAFLQLTDWPAQDRAGLVAAVREAASSDQDSAWAVELADRYPDDPGVVGALLLNRLTLSPGQACYVAPDTIHGYLHGTVIEVLGCSDNVVRAGLTSKHVATEELRPLLRVDSAPPALLETTSIGDDEERWLPPRPEFQLGRLRVDGQRVAERPYGPEILLCVDGEVEVCGANQSITLASGEAAFVSATERELTIVGQGVIIRATTGELSTTAGFAA